jgi:flagellar basal-body rod modification protein FlgD
VTNSIFGPGSLGKDDFLLLLVTQLRHQDPLEPLDAQDFASQLAEFTALEQQIETNELLTEQNQLRAAEMLEAQNSVAIGLIGKGVVVPGSRLDLTGSGNEAAFVSTSGAGRLTIRLTDGAGRIVQEIEADVSAGGVQRIALGGDVDLPAGTYSVSVEAQTEGLVVAALGGGVVSGVRWGESGPSLVIGDREVPLSEVLQITN